MNILFINSIAAHKYGGGEKWMIKAAKGLTGLGHKVILASKRNSHILKKAEENNVQTTVLNTHTDFSPLDTWKIARFLSKEKIDILICNLNKDVRVAGLAAKIIGHPLVIARHGVKLISNKWKHKMTLTKLADAIITNTETIKKEYLSYNWFNEDFIKVIYNGVDTNRNIKAYDFQKDYPGKKVIFSAGRLTEQKGFRYLIETADILYKKRDDLVFVIAGKGRLEGELKSNVSRLGLNKFVHFIGFVENYIKGADLFVLPSLFEGMPNVVMEAMANAKAVIATDVNGARELMLDRESGFIVPPENPLLMAEKIDNLIDDNTLLKTMGEKGQQHVLKNFTINKMVKNLENYLKKMLDEKINRETEQANNQKNKTIFAKIFSNTDRPLKSENL